MPPTPYNSHHPIAAILVPLTQYHCLTMLHPRYALHQPHVLLTKVADEECGIDA